ncbi:hypothetical protein [Paracraurococcus lichenis]|uniref:Uncharacterized protein n=1 Tax=Paracraurococcus lichenis TaxID=3064888 RepID=A0ABT9DW24_9PROT|nr:hypothetical protein [Paracraurococcus sp. LOR1-02]MDO9708100.1 hypothetical protein [Paracraurococcus sp. LOR1-02]
MVSAIGALLTFLLGSTLVVYGEAVRGAMEQASLRAATARLPRGAAQESA